MSKTTEYFSDLEQVTSPLGFGSCICEKQGLGQLKSKLIRAWEARYEWPWPFLSRPLLRPVHCAPATLSPLTLDKPVPWPLWFALLSI